MTELLDLYNLKRRTRATRPQYSALTQAEIDRYYEKDISKLIPTQKDIIKAALNSVSQGRGSRICKLAFALEATKAGSEALKNPVVKNQLQELKKAMDNVSAPIAKDLASALTNAAGSSAFGRAVTTGSKLGRYHNPRQEQQQRQRARGLHPNIHSVKADEMNDSICLLCGQKFSSPRFMAEHRYKEHGAIEKRKQNRFNSGDKEALDERVRILSEATGDYKDYLAQEKRLQTLKLNPELQSHEDKSTQSEVVQGLIPYKPDSMPSYQPKRLRPVGEKDQDEEEANDIQSTEFEQ